MTKVAYKVYKSKIMIINLPDYDTYMKAVRKARYEMRINDKQVIILRNCYKARMKDSPLHFNYLQKDTAQSKEDARWDIMDLVEQGAIRQIRPNWYML